MDIITKFLGKGKGWKAWLADNKKVWEAGKTEAEAVGKLTISAAGYLGIAVINEDED